jgi:predicted kinase
MSFVVDNTNVLASERSKYIAFAKQYDIPLIGYYFKTNIEQSLEWNSKRIGKECIPKVGILGTYNKLQIPSIEEGFTKLFYVDSVNGNFIVKEWKDEI